MNRGIIIIIFLSLSYCIYSQEMFNERYALTTSSTSVGVGSIQLLDPYLSPYQYEGYQLGMFTNKERFFKPDKTNLSFFQLAKYNIGLAHHPNSSNSMIFFQADCHVGVYYHFRPSNNWKIRTGGSWDIGVGGKYIGRNVNNPFSLDFSTNINAACLVQHHFSIKKQNFTVQYGAIMPLLGCMFVPAQGVSYYELFMLDDPGEAFHFSWLKNKQNYMHYLNLNIPTNITTFKVSLMQDYQIYQANNMTFRKNEFTLSLGAVVDLYIFSGKKRKIPSNFVLTNE